MSTGNCQPAISDGSPVDEGFALFKLVSETYVLQDANCPSGTQPPAAPPFDPKNPHPFLKCECVPTASSAARPTPPETASADG